ncbi:MAG: MATE family efflux transporter [Oscillospiraceae bacterium]|nr:MATE family efflux transporter [Oscillospiraceae bacterium]
MINDMTKGSPSKIIFFFAMPMILGNLFQQLYNIVDSVVVGNFVGEDALAAVGASFPIMFMAIAIATGASMGCSVVISQLFGAKRNSEMKTAVFTAIISLFALAAVLAIIGLFIASPFLRLLKTPENIMADSAIYLRIFFAGFPFLFLYNSLTSVYNALGDSKTPLIFLIMATVINIGLDLLFVIVFEMGVAGVAWATLIAQGFSAIISLVNLLNRLRKFEAGKYKIYSFKSFLQMIRIAIPSMIQQSIVSIGMLLIQNLVNSYGSSVVAGYTAATKLDSIALLPMINIASAVSSFTAQNVGANEIERVKKGYRASLLLCLVFCAIITLVIMLFGNVLINLFVDSEASAFAIEVGVGYLKQVSIFYMVMGLMFATGGVLRGAGDITFFMLGSLVNLICRTVSAYSMAAYTSLEYRAIWWSIPIGWATGSIVLLIRYFSGKWKDKSVVKI